MGIGLAVLGFSFLAQFCYSIRDGWHDAGPLIAAAGIYTCVAAILPPVACLHSARYPDQAQFIWLVWLGLVALCMLIIVAQVAWSASANAANLDPREATLLKAGMLLKGMFFGVCPAAAGWLCSLSVTGHAESYRLAFGEAGMLAPSAAPPRVEAIGMTSPTDIFSAWAENRLLPAPMSAAGVEGNRAYLDYAETCALNGVAPMNEKRFGLMLTARSEQSYGPEAKHRSNGKVRYKGWSLPEETREIQDVTYSQIEGPR